MKHLRDLARQQLEDAHAAATAHGIEIARRLRPASYPDAGCASPGDGTRTRYDLTGEQSQNLQR
jgi:hypothetical protein